MHQMNIDRPNLNLLAVFDAVAETGSVTHAAARLSLSQPAVSHALNRLRDQMQDPLFVRGRNRLVTTPRAEAMIAPVRKILDASRQVFATEAFSPATSTRAFRIGASDYAMMTVMPGLVRALRRLAPMTSLEICPAGPSLLAQLEQGDMDATFWGTDPPSAPYKYQLLFEECFVGLVCPRHPMVGKIAAGALTLDDYLNYPHVMVSFRDPQHSPIDARLAELGHARRKGFTTPSFTANIAALAGTDLVMTSPSRLAAHADQHSLITFGLPFDVPAYCYSLVWHRRTESDPANLWLRNLVQDLSAVQSVNE
jgi:DNA-binding transcriptional LysR family regulator